MIDILALMLAGVGLSLVVVESSLFEFIREGVFKGRKLCMPCLAWWGGLLMALLVGYGIVVSLVVAFGSHFLAVFLRSVRLEDE